MEKVNHLHKIINFKRPSIKVIGDLDNSQLAWRISRPHLSENDPELMKIKTMDLPIHSFHHINFEITSSILLRDLLYHIRPSADWARSNRTTQINDKTLFYSGEYKLFYRYGTFLDKHYEQWTKCIDTSVNLDIRKDNFPYMVSTDYCFGVDIRTLSSLLRSMKKSIPWLYEVYGELFFDALKEYGIWNLDCLPPGSDNLIESLAIDDSIEENRKTKVEYHRDFDTVFIQYYGKASLLSQFIRQHMAKVRSSFINRLMKIDSLLKSADLVQSELYSMQSITTVELVEKLMKTRSCWFAKFDMDSKSSWSDIVTELISESGDRLLKVIPCRCNSNNCPWKNEQLARCLAGNPENSKGEVNVPCPFITGIKELGELREAKFGSNSKLFNLWKDELKSLKLKITEHGKFYIDNLVKYGFVEECDNNNPKLKKLVKQLNEKYS